MFCSVIPVGLKQLRPVLFSKSVLRSFAGLGFGFK